MFVAISEEVLIFNVLLPTIVALVFLLFIWGLDRTLSGGAERTPARSKLLSHGFLFVLGTGYLICWNAVIARLVHFPEIEVWKPLAAVWGFLVFYDGWRRVEIQKMHAEAEFEPSDESAAATVSAREGWRLNVATILRLLAFFALLGAISSRRVVAFILVALIIGAIWLLERKRQPATDARAE